MFTRFATLCVLALASVAVQPGTALAQSSPVSQAIADGTRLVHESREIFLAGLTPLQRALLPRIEREQAVYRAATGCAIPATRENLIIMMRRVGAPREEAPFVYDRLVAGERMDDAATQFDHDLRSVNAQTCATLGLFCDGARPIATCRQR
jgi:hypothetical protein